MKAVIEIASLVIAASITLLAIAGCNAKPEQTTKLDSKTSHAAFAGKKPDSTSKVRTNNNINRHAVASEEYFYPEYEQAEVSAP